MSVTRYHGQLSSCTISGKPKNPILRKLGDGWMDRWTDGRTDGWTDESNFIRRCPSNVEHPITVVLKSNHFKGILLELITL